MLRPYFRRVWIVQEMLKASKLDLVIGHRLIPWDDFERAVYSWRLLESGGGNRIMDEVMLDIVSPEAEESADTWMLALSIVLGKPQDSTLKFLVGLILFPVLCTTTIGSVSCWYGCSAYMCRSAAAWAVRCCALIPSLVR